jgi:hypothetical protein
MVVTAPVVGLFYGVATGEDGARVSDFVEKVFPKGRLVIGFRRRPRADVNPNQSCSRMKSSPPGLSGLSFGPAMYPSSDIDM